MCSTFKIPKGVLFNIHKGVLDPPTTTPTSVPAVLLRCTNHYKYLGYTFSSHRVPRSCSPGAGSRLSSLMLYRISQVCRSPSRATTSVLSLVNPRLIGSGWIPKTSSECSTSNLKLNTPLSAPTTSASAVMDGHGQCSEEVERVRMVVAWWHAKYLKKSR